MTKATSSSPFGATRTIGKTLMLSLRNLAAVSGLILLGATAHVTIIHTGGYSGQQAILTLAIAAGVGVGALTIGAAWGSRRRGLALWLVAALLCGEAFGLAMTAERLVTAREAAQAPLREHMARVDKARARVTVAEKALASVSTTPRLQAALTAKATADKAAVDKSAERGCAKNCRELLQAQVDAAAAEVDRARQAIETDRLARMADLKAARGALATMKAPESPSPLADRLGVTAWVLDLVTAALGSMAANGLAVGLLAFAAHGRRHETPEPTGISRKFPKEAPGTRPKPKSPNVVRVLGEIVQPADRKVRVEIEQVLAAYVTVCRAKGVPVAGGDDFVAQAKAFADAAGIRILSSGGKVFWCGVQLVA
jgi:hypothetical protein